MIKMGMKLLLQDSHPNNSVPDSICGLKSEFPWVDSAASGYNWGEMIWVASQQWGDLMFYLYWYRLVLDLRSQTLYIIKYPVRIWSALSLTLN